MLNSFNIPSLKLTCFSSRENGLCLYHITCSWSWGAKTKYLNNFQYDAKFRTVDDYEYCCTKRFQFLTRNYPVIIYNKTWKWNRKDYTVKMGKFWHWPCFHEIPVLLGALNSKSILPSSAIIVWVRNGCRIFPIIFSYFRTTQLLLN